MTRKDYAKKHKTKEWIFCQNCKKEFFRTISRQQDKKYGQFCCRKCATEYTIPFVSQTFKVNVLKNHDMASKRSKKAAATRKEKDFYKSERFLRGRAKCKQTLFEHFGIFSYVFPRFSLESQELFYLIEQNLSKQLTCYYATKQNELFGTILENGHKMSGEFQVWVHGNHFCRFLDFYVKELNVCIEFDEESHEKEESIKEDIIRENDIKKALPTIKILRVKKRDFLTDRDKALRECLDFIYLYFSHKSHSQKSTLLLAQRPVP